VDDLRPLIDQQSRARSVLEYARLSGRGVDSAGEHLRASRAALAAAVRAAAASAPPELAEQLSRIARETATDPVTRGIERIDALQAVDDAALFQSDALVRAACEQVAQLSRLQIIRRALRGPEGLMSRLQDDGPVEIFGFSDQLYPLDLDEPADAPDASRTDPANAMREVSRRLAQQNLSAMALFSDGREVDPISAVPFWNLPTVAVLAGTAPVRDVTIDHVVLPESAFVDEPISIRVTLRASLANGSMADVNLSVDGQRLTQRVQIQRNAASADFTVQLHRPGPQELEISVPPLASEATSANNRVHRVVKINAQTQRVALLAGFATRDALQLRRSLRDMPGVELVELSLGGEPAHLDEVLFERLDLLILSDVQVSALTPRQWDAINRVVSDHGGSVLLMASDPATLAGYAGNPLPGALLPWRGESAPAWRTWPGEDAVFRVVPAEAAAETLPLSNDPDLSRRRWNQLPPLFRYLALPPLKPGTRPLLVERDSGLPVLTEMRLGAGRVYFLGINEIWRWRASDDSIDPDRIWRQLIAVAGAPAYTVAEGSLALDASPLDLVPLQPRKIRARSRRSADAPVLNVYRDGQFQRTVRLAPTAASFEYETTLSDLTAGAYDMRLLSDDESVSLPIKVAENDEDEMRDVSADRLALRRLAGTRGETITIDELETLPQRLGRMRQSEQGYAELRLWDSMYLFLFVLGCFGLEWAIRKHAGLS
jgi:hypothetical protein